MRSLCLAFVVAAGVALFVAASGNAQQPQADKRADKRADKVTVAQLAQTLAAEGGVNDVDLAQQLAHLELTERLNASEFARLSGMLPGEHSREALILLADKSAFLAPPQSEIANDPDPDGTATRAMLVGIVGYVNTTLRQLPNLIAARRTIGFEDRPNEDVLEATGTVSYSYQPLHSVGRSIAAVTFRDRKESVEEGSGKGNQGKVGGLITTGEFGPILSTVVADALKGRITWARWEQGSLGKMAVFRYTVPENRSNYHVQFCCIVESYDGTGQPRMQVFNERAGYHGEITFNPADGSILRMTVEAELSPSGLVPQAGIAIDYGLVEIGGRRYICPQHSVSKLAAHVAKPEGMYSKAMYQGPAKNFLNDIVFGDYKRFGSETRILAGENLPPEPR